MGNLRFPAQGPYQRLYAVGVYENRSRVIKPGDGGICFGAFLNHGSDKGLQYVLYPVRPLEEVDYALEMAKFANRDELIDWWLNIVKNVWGIEGFEDVSLDELKPYSTDLKQKFVRCFKVPHVNRIQSLIRLTLLRYLEEQVITLCIMRMLCNADPKRFDGGGENLYHAFFTAHNVDDVGATGNLGTGHSIMRYDRKVTYKLFMDSIHQDTGDIIQVHQHDLERVDTYNLYTFDEIIKEGKGYLE